MAYTFRRGDIMVVRADHCSKAKKGYIVFWGRYPRRNRYVLRKREAVRFAKHLASR